MRIYPAATLSALGAVWSIGELDKTPRDGVVIPNNYWVLKDGKRTTGHAMWLDFIGGSIVVQSPRTLTQWKTLNGQVWTETGPAIPATAFADVVNGPLTWRRAGNN